MFVWIDRDTFKIDGKLHILNYANVALIAVYGNDDDDGYAIKAKFNNGDMYLGGWYSNLDDAEKDFKKFIDARPPEIEKKEKIKLT